MDSTKNEREVQLVEVKCNDSYNLKVEELEKILKNERVKDLPVVVVSIAGAYRGGKSFLQNFLLRYLKATPQKQSDGTWLDDIFENGFSWKSGCDPHTNGITMWGEPIVTTLPSGEKAAVILVDTQGTSDCKSTERDCSTIFALSTLLSSIQIYNISKQIDENDLQALELFSKFGLLAADKTDVKPYQFLEFLVRDWQHVTDHDYGCEGGKQYFNEKFEIKNSSNETNEPNIIEESSQNNDEIKKLRENIANSFESVSCFLLPNPKKSLNIANFTGKSEELSVKFIKHIKELTSYIFGPKMLKHKSIGGVTVTAGELCDYFKRLVEVFNSREIPPLQNIMEVIAESNLLSAFEEARRLYETSIEVYCNPDLPSLPTHDLEELHENCSSKAINTFIAKKKMSSDKVDEYLNRLTEELANRRPQIREANSAKTHRWFNQAKVVYESNFEHFGDKLQVCVNKLDLAQVYTEALNTVIESFDINRTKLSDKEDTEKAGYLQYFKDEFTSLSAFNALNNMTAVNYSCTSYGMRMENECGVALSEEDFQAAHNDSLEEALRTFDDKRYQSVRETDEYRLKLIQKIEHRRNELKNINKSNNRSGLFNALKVYDDYIKSVWDSKYVCLHPGDLNQEHKKGERLALSALRPSKAASTTAQLFFDINDEDEKSLSQSLHERFIAHEELNNARNESAVHVALTQYREDTVLPILVARVVVAVVSRYLLGQSSNSNGVIDESKDKARKRFYALRRSSTNTERDRFLEDLESVRELLLERMDEERLTKQIYETSVNGPASRGQPRRTYLDQIGDVLKKGQVKSTYNRRACMKALMKVEEAKEVCQDRSRWKEVISAYPNGKKA